MSIDKVGRHLYKKMQQLNAPTTPLTKTSHTLYLCQEVSYYSKCMLTITAPYTSATPAIYCFPVGSKIESVKIFPENLWFYFSTKSFDSKQVIGQAVQKDTSLYLGDKTDSIPSLTYAEIVL